MTESSNKAHASCIVIPDAENTYPLDQFAVPQHYKDDLNSVMIPNGLILNRLEKLAQDIVEDIHAPLVVLCVLKGGHQVFSDLVNFIKQLNTRAGRSLPLSLEFIRMKSYHNDQSSGKVEIIGMNMSNLKGKHVLVVEDIVDTGRSLVKLCNTLNEQGPETLRTFSLLLKRTPHSNGFQPDYVGFEIPDEFVVGYCLDYNEYFRDLDHICIISPVGREKYKEAA
ncbi:hypoxanthine-guanine phosphoribosyltransferase [Sphaeroforma arctica JP610]|uniref:Hypoxanthine phosphoribosyltransferase n=1 Tax=Sphaeroforma arctica JP610 TaxID=667725 RepID=A0A0L0FHZ6_9EUKA|nr:hypoxanthine-guanine phosphoribosyltransferase [Sphaeroforma arctica JP610]KNC76414.1 hypoxanthine-guanine phosphoribosyltransferase [Sphaeroforma arctica JP610]|eukprot:XP_014150316.1 hypoxanthine-guanine phosphoribosyltransferase [Sphaeroforma arctica JP610]